ncbi:MAG: DUF2189 domain-containing protein [Dechloromonas sp.]|nr:MAG: DUF2189 domain-containing protein [Dechloromonas sp.]
MRHSFDFDVAGFSLPAVRNIAAGRTLAWLQAGWQDLLANPLPSLAYGLLFALGGDLIILAVLNHPHLLTVAISGFFLVAPLLAAGLYELSRARGCGERLMFIDSLRCFRRNGQSLALFGLLLALMAIIWERFSAIAFALIGGDMVGSAILSDIILDGQHLGFIVTWFAIGAILALAVFALAVISVPMMLDRDVDVATAMLASLRAVAHNPGPLLLWAVIIVALTLLGFASLLFGLILIMPVLGHASWHAYRDLVE